MPPTSFFLIGAVFHYLGPSLAVLLFAHVAAPGVAWLRIASAAVVFALWRRPWRIFTAASPGQRLVFAGLAAVLAAMNVLFYLAIDRLPLATVGAIEFLGTVILAAIGARTRRNVLALALAIGGVAVLTSVQLAGQPLGYLFAFANCAGFMLYILLGHRIANTAVAGGSPGLPLSGIDQLGLAMLIAAAAVTPFGLVPAAPAFTHPAWLMWGIGVGVCSSVIPYVTDQLAMSRLPRATFSLMLALLPATAAVIGLIVLGQVPTMRSLTGIGLVILGVALRRDPPRREEAHQRDLPGAPPPSARGAGARSRRQGRKLGLEDLVGVDAHGCEVPGDLQADQAVQAAPDEDGAQGDRRVNVERVCVRPRCELGCERLAGRGGRTVA
jgi:inner membrane transporter RhtA